jgi:hypothetical protein
VDKGVSETVGEARMGRELSLGLRVCSSVLIEGLTKTAETSLFEAELPHHPAALRSVLPPEPDPLAERCDPRVFPSLSHNLQTKAALG